MANITIFDIETYKRHFCFVGNTYDEYTKELLKQTVVESKDGKVSSAEMYEIEQCLGGREVMSEDGKHYIVSFNGTRFDLPVLVKMQKDIKRLGSTPTSYIHADASAIMSYDRFNNPVVRKHPTNREWSVKHFDFLNCCLLNKSLKQWEMYENLRIEVLPYNPNADELTEEQCREITEYCKYDVEATAIIFWRKGYDKCDIIGRPAFKAYEFLFERLHPSLQYRFDRPTASLASAILYQSNQVIPPKTIDPFKLFDINAFDVPIDVKLTIAQISRSSDKLADTTVNGITYGKGGLHFAKRGMHRNVYNFDVESMYPNIVIRWGLLKTPEALRRYQNTKVERLSLKKTGDIMGYGNQALKLILNAFTGALRMRGGHNVAYDNAAGEAMCYIGQLILTELITAVPPGAMIEGNTDGIMVVGEEAAEKVRIRAREIEAKYCDGDGVILFEEEFIDTVYIRDVNNYVIYDKDGNYIKGKGDDDSDLKRKKSNLAVNKEAFRHLILPKLDMQWSKYDWTDFIYKYHKSAASKYASIGGQPMTRKDYYMLWTTRDCPDSQTISFTRDLINKKNGSIKARWGVYAFDVKNLEKYAPYIDFEQYQRDFDDTVELWGREDLCTTRLSKIQRKGLTLSDLRY